MLKKRDCSNKNELYGLYACLCFVWQCTKKGGGREKTSDYLTRGGAAPRRIMNRDNQPNLVSLRSVRTLSWPSRYRLQANESGGYEIRAS
jgi:hypothetical protein